MINPLLLLYVAATSGGIVLLKMGSSSGAVVEFIDGKLNFNINLVNSAGIILYLISFLLYLYLIAKNDLGYIVPVTTALVYVVVFFASSVLFREHFTAVKILGILLIIIGAILLNVKR